MQQPVPVQNNLFLRRHILPLLSLILLLSGLSFQARAGHGIYESLIKVGGNFYSLKGTTFNSYQNASLGSFTVGKTLLLNGGEVKTYKNNGDNVTGADLFYTVYPQGARPTSPAFASYTLPFAANLNNGNGDQSWNTYVGNVNLLEGLRTGTYTLEVFSRSSVSYNGGGSGFEYESNNGSNYTASFAVTAAPLPVELTSFEAVSQGNAAILAWATASEKNNRGFEVQASSNGLEFRTLGFVAGAGNSAAAHGYRFIDTEQGKAGVRYYRLRQLDVDGAASFSPVRTVDFAGLRTAMLEPWPSPFGAELTLKVHALTAQPTTRFSFVDATGRTLLTQYLDVPAGSSQLAVAGLELLPKGWYMLQASLNGQPVRLKVIKQ